MANFGNSRFIPYEEEEAPSSVESRFIPYEEPESPSLKSKFLKNPYSNPKSPVDIVNSLKEDAYKVGRSIKQGAHGLASSVIGLGDIAFNSPEAINQRLRKVFSSHDSPVQNETEKEFFPWARKYNEWADQPTNASERIFRRAGSAAIGGPAGALLGAAGGAAVEGGLPEEYLLPLELAAMGAGTGAVRQAGAAARRAVGRTKLFTRPKGKTEGGLIRYNWHNTPERTVISPNNLKKIEEGHFKNINQAVENLSRRSGRNLTRPTPEQQSALDQSWNNFYDEAERVPAMSVQSIPNRNLQDSAYRVWENRHAEFHRQATGGLGKEYNQTYHRLYNDLPKKGSTRLQELLNTRRRISKESGKANNAQTNVPKTDGEKLAYRDFLEALDDEIGAALPSNLSHQFENNLKIGSEHYIRQDIGNMVQEAGRGNYGPLKKFLASDSEKAAARRYLGNDHFQDLKNLARELDYYGPPSSRFITENPNINVIKKIHRARVQRHLKKPARESRFGRGEEN
jgi:hypothetical protein